MWNISQLEIETGISARRLELLRKFDKKLIDADKTTLSLFQINKFQFMLSSFIGDLKINKQLKTFSLYSRDYTGISGQTIGLIKNLSYRTRHLKKIAPEMDRIWVDFNDVVQNGKQLEENKKLSLQQYGILHDLASLDATMNYLDTLGLIKGRATLESLYKNTQRAQTMIKHFDKTFNAQFVMPAGSIVLENPQDKSNVLGKKLGLFDRLIMFFITRFLHVSKGISVHKGENIISHINPSYKEEAFNLRSFLYSDIYRIKLDNLIDKKMHPILKKAYGEDWIKRIEEKYSDIERFIHDNANRKHSHITAEDSPLSRAKIATKYLHGGNKNLFAKNHENAMVRDSILGREKWGEERRDTCKMLCSEFIGMTLIAAITELNDVLKQDLSKKGFHDLPKKIIRNPISQHEKMDLLTPERLLTAMQKRGAVEKIVPSTDVKAFIRKNRGFKESMHKMAQDNSITDNTVKNPMNNN